MIDIDTQVPINIAMANQAIARQVAETLEKHYPGHGWMVRANVETGIVQIYNLLLDGNWGFVLKIDALATDPSMKLTIRAGGELLERYNLSRSALKVKEYESIKRDFKGDAKQL